MTQTPTPTPETEAPPERTPLPAHPYRRTVLVNLVLAGVLFAFAWILGSGLVDSTIYAVFYFVVATALNSLRVWQRRRERESESESEAAE